MKKIVSVILLCALLLICLLGCNSNNNGDNTEQSSTTVATSRFKPNLKKNPPASDTPTEPQVLDNESELIKTLIKYLQELHVCKDMYFLSLSEKIDSIKGGAEPLYVGFDSSSYYYVCGYSNNAFACLEKEYCSVTNEPRSKTSWSDYCHAITYTWVRFEKESEIPEYYNGENFVAGFQLNRSLGVTNILSVEANVPNIERFMRYQPEFKDGMNVKPSTVIKDEFFIFLNSSDKDNIYHSLETLSDHDNITIPCVQIEDRYYIYTYGIEEWNFGKYYDRIMSIAHTETIENYDTIDVISIEAFVNEIIKK